MSCARWAAYLTLATMFADDLPELAWLAQGRPGSSIWVGPTMAGRLARGWGTALERAPLVPGLRGPAAEPQPEPDFDTVLEAVRLASDPCELSVLERLTSLAQPGQFTIRWPAADAAGHRAASHA